MNLIKVLFKELILLRLINFIGEFNYKKLTKRILFR